ncbi:MAG: MlrC C-terminal domain-containing protein, partial [Kordiimonas sp.]
PHVDMAETGARAAFLLSGALENGGPIALMHKFKKPIAMTDQYTKEGTLHAFMNWLKTRDNNSIGMHIEFAAGFPLADVKDCGPALITYAASELAADKLLKDSLRHIMPYISAKPQRLYTVDEAYNHYLKMAANSPIVWADVQDNPGCGGMGNTVGILRYLLARGVDDCLLGVLNCPEIAKKAHETGIGRTIKVDWDTYDKPLRGDVTVEALSDGQFSGSGAFYHGCDFDLGLMACVRAGGVGVIVSSKPQQAADRAMFEHLGIRPDEARLLVLKSAVHFRADFSDMAAAIFLIKADGMAPADPLELSYKKAFEGNTELVKQ